MNKKTLVIIAAVVILAAVGAIVFTQFPRKGSESGRGMGQENGGQEIGQSTAKPEAKLVALGSSLSRASNLSTKMQGENPEQSFSTGTEIDSVYTFLKSKEGNLTATNLAAPGANMEDILDRQLSRALSLNPKYITIDPAADIVSKNSIPQYRKDLNQILDRINPKTTIMIFTYPNFTKMRTANYSSCQENKVGVKLGNLSEKNILSFNQTIKEITKNRSNVILIDTYSLLGQGDVSDYDCLHVNLGAQKKIASEFIKMLSSEGR